MSYICLHCGHAFEQPEAKHYDLACGTWDEYCPNCGSEDIEEAVQCSICKKWFSPDETVHGVCDNCLEKNMTVATATKYGADRKISVELNGFLAWVFDGRIEDILTQHLQNVYDLKQLGVDYCADDKHDFAEWLEEKHDAE